MSENRKRYDRRLAIQFFGHLRTFDKTYQSFYQNIILPNRNSGYEIDVYMHAWDELEYCNWQWHNDKTPWVRGKKLTQAQIDFVKAKYNPVVLEISPQIRTEDTTVFPEFTGGKTSYVTMLNVWFTKFRVNELRREYQQKHAVKYDYVLNTRADVSYRKPLIINDVVYPYAEGLLSAFDCSDGKLFYSGYHRDQPIRDERLLSASDVLYFGTPDVMDRVSSIFPTLDKQELSEHFLSWEDYQNYTARKYGIAPIQITYAPENRYASDYGWRIARLSEFKESGKESPRALSYKIQKNLIKCFPIKKTRRKLLGRLDEKYGFYGTVLQKETAKVMCSYAEKFLAGGANPFIAKLKKTLDHNVIWQFWWQGIDEETPKIVRACMASIEKHKGNRRVILITKDNLREYADFPDFVYDRIGTDGFNLSHFSDLLRLYLLSVYGGVWLDATIYMTAPLDDNVGEKFFAYQRSEKIPDDWRQWAGLNADYFSWKRGFCVRLCNSFLAAPRGNKLLGDMLSILLDYWKNEPRAGHYFFFQILFNKMIDMSAWRALNCEVTNDTDIHRLLLHAQAAYDERIWKNTVLKTNIHKLTYLDHVTPNSFLAHVLNSYEMPYDQPWRNKRDDITFCTMLFRMKNEGNLAKIKNTDRKFEDFYLVSLRKFIRKFGKVAIWCDKETRDFIDANGIGESVKTKILEFTELPRYQNRHVYLEFLREMKKKSMNKGYLLHDLDPEDVVDYLILTMSKIDALKWAKDNNFFDSPYLLWLDSGTFNPIYAKFWQNWDGIIDVCPQKNKFVFMTHFRRIFQSLIKISSYEDIALIKAPFEIFAGMMAFRTDKFDEFFDAYSNAISFLEQRRLVTTEQSLFSIMLKKGYPFDFAKTYDYRDCINLVAHDNCRDRVREDVFRGLLKELFAFFIRMIPFERERDKLLQREIYKGIWK